MAHQPVQSSAVSRYSKLETTTLETAAQDVVKQKRLRFREHFWGGWRTTVTSGVVITLIALITNFILLIWASKQRPPDNHIGHGVVTLFNGECSKMNKIFTWSHLAVNVVSTLLLSAGTACMQCLSAPTRQEVDKAHAKSTYLDIGIPSLRNVKWIARPRQVLWLLLGLSSLPLHLFYNSVIFSTTAANDYSAIMVADDFLHGGVWDGTLNSDGWNGAWLDAVNSTQQVQHLQDNLATLTRLDNDQCVKSYQTNLMSDYKDVLLVTDVSNATNAILGVIPQLVTEYTAEGSGCSGSFTCWPGSNKDSKNWTFTLFPGTGFENQTSGLDQSDLDKQHPNIQVPVRYCLAEPGSPACTISLSRVYLGVVLICNAIKLFCILSTLLLKGHQPLITIGDAIESFLVDPDPMTRATTWSASELRKQRPGTQWSKTSSKPWFPFRHRWFEAASSRRWAVTALCLCLVWGSALALLVKGAEQSSDHQDIWRNGLGVLNLDAILPFSESMGVTTDVLIVNSPQVIISFIYLLYNGLFTCMLLSAEYLKFASQRRTLRVTCPRSNQRSTYWLQLPYRYAIPFLIAMGVLHWLVSQSIFLVRVAVIDQYGNQDYSREVGGCGWSPDALVATIVVGALVIAALVGFGFRRLPDGMPVASSCSGAISAACHRADGEGEDMVLMPLKYGIVNEIEEVDSNRVGFRQVGFSAGEVQPLIEEGFYGSRTEGICPDDDFY